MHGRGMHFDNGSDSVAIIMPMKKEIYFYSTDTLQPNAIGDIVPLHHTQVDGH